MTVDVESILSVTARELKTRPRGERHDPAVGRPVAARDRRDHQAPPPGDVDRRQAADARAATSCASTTREQRASTRPTTTTTIDGAMTRRPGRAQGRRCGRRADRGVGLQAQHGPDVGGALPRGPSADRRGSRRAARAVDRRGVDAAHRAACSGARSRRRGSSASAASTTRPRPASGRWCRACSASASCNWISTARDAFEEAQARSSSRAATRASKLIAERIAGLTQLAQVGAHLLESMLEGEAIDSAAAQDGRRAGQRLGTKNES